jgi:hypothetical protein
MSTEIKAWAVLDADNLVINVVLWDGESDWNPDAQTIELTDHAGVGIGWKWNGTTFDDVRPASDELEMN